MYEDRLRMALKHFRMMEELLVCRSIEEDITLLTWVSIQTMSFESEDGRQDRTDGNSI